MNREYFFGENELIFLTRDRPTTAERRIMQR